jgi:Flp pilus assembly pilin Flp
LKQEEPMKSCIRNLLVGEQGQDLVEYTLLLAFVVLSSAALFIGVGSSIRGIWTQSSRILSQACTAGS